MNILTTSADSPTRRTYDLPNMSTHGNSASLKHKIVRAFLKSQVPVLLWTALMVLVSGQGLAAQDSRQPQGNPVHEDWIATDVGEVEIPGKTEYQGTGEYFIMTGSGEGVGGEQDAFHYCYRKVSGNFCLKVRLMRNHDPAAQTGIMLRESLAPDARYHKITALSSFASHAGYRMQVGEQPEGNAPVRMEWWPSWLMIGRWGDQIGMWYSQDGDTWHYSRFGGTLRGLSDEVYVGMFRSESENGQTAEFDQVQLGSIEEVMGYRTSWLGNSLSGGDKWVQAGVRAMHVDVETGRVFLSGIDEKQGTSVYGPDGRHIAPGKHSHFCAGPAIAGDANHYYHARTGGKRGGGIAKYIHRGDHAKGTHRVFEGKVFVGLALHGDRLYAADSEEPVIYILDKKTLSVKGNFRFEHAGPMTADAEGNLWIVQQGKEGDRASVVQVGPAGDPTGKVITEVDNPRGLAVHPETGEVYVADQYPRQQILIFKPDGKLTGTFGVENGIYADLPEASRGVVHPDKLNHPVGVGFDREGNLYVASNGPPSGTELRKYSTTGELMWEKYGLEYVDMADPDHATDGMDVYTCEHHYKLDLSKGPGAEWSNYGMTYDPHRYPDDPRATERGAAPTLIRRIEGKRILFVQEMKGKWMAWYHFEPNSEIAVPAGMMAPNRDGHFYDWRDKNGDAAIQPEEVDNSGERLAPFTGWYPDETGSLWVAGKDRKVRYYPCSGLDKHGNPIYAEEPTVWEPEVFAGKGGDISKLYYYTEKDVLYIGGYTPVHPSLGSEWGSMGREVVRYDGWLHGDRELVWRLNLPYMPKPKGGHLSYVATSIDVAGDYLFTIESASALVRVYDLEHAQHVATLFQGPEVAGITGLIDVGQGVTAHRRENGEYLIFAEEDSRAKIIMFRWRPPME